MSSIAANPHRIGKDLIMVAMSGGVDSSVSASVLQARGCQIAGMFMKNWEEDDRQGLCTAAEDAVDAQGVADQLGIALHRRNFAAEYWDQVFEEFLDEYRAGRTPNPDVLCNREIKFKTFIDHAQDLGASHIATGHYVRSDAKDGLHRLLRGIDDNKDQSYFLYAIGQEQLAQSIFPIGELTKPEVRCMAENEGFANHDKKDSTGICFIGERDFKGFLSQYLEPESGEIRSIDEQLLGEHDGLMFYTLGQRQGMNIGGVSGCAEGPWYVVHKDRQRNVLYAGQGHYHDWLMSDRLVATQLNWVAGFAPRQCERLTAKVRYRQSDQQCDLIALDTEHIEVRFEVPQRAITPGQSVVLYDGAECLGGGIIDWAATIPAGTTPTNGL